MPLGELVCAGGTEPLPQCSVPVVDPKGGSAAAAVRETDVGLNTETCSAPDEYL